MTSIQDPFDNEDFIAENLGNETDGKLRNIDLDEGTVLSFNGSSQYGLTGSNVFNPSATDFTLMCWFKANSFNSIIFSQNDGTGTGRTMLKHNTNGTIGTSIGGITINATTVAPTDEWHHAAVTKSGTSLLLYLDGVLDGSGTATAESADGITNMGVHKDLSQQPWDGELDNWRIYSEALSADTLFALVEAGIEPSTTNLEVHYKLNHAGADAVAVDSSSNSNDATLVNTPVWTTTHKPFYTTRARTTSIDLVSSATSVDTFKHTGCQKSGGTVGRFQFSNDNSIWENANGDSVINDECRAFDGIGNYLSASEANYRAGDFSGAITAWIYVMTTNAINNSTIFSSGDDSGSANDMIFALDFTESNGMASLMFRSRNSSVNNDVQTVRLIPLYQWVFVAISSSGTAYTLWIDGIEESHTLDAGLDNGNWFADMATQRDRIGIGARLRNSTQVAFFHGFIDDVRVHSTEPSADEMYDLYTRHKPTGYEESHWKFDGNLEDSGPEEADLSNTGSTSNASWYQCPGFGEADLERVNVPVFDALNDYAEKTFANFRSGDSSGTITAWINSRDSVPTQTIFGSFDTATLNHQLNWFIGAGVMQIAANISGVTTRVSCPIPANTGWVHLAVVSNSSDWFLYVNGKLMPITIQAGSNSGNWFADVLNRDNIVIGNRQYSSPNNFFDGSIGMVCVRSGQLTQAQIQTEVEQGYVDTAIGSVTNLWKCSDGSGNLIDSVGTDADKHDLVQNGYGWEKRADAPADAVPTQQSIDITGLGYTNDFYYRFLLDSGNLHLVYSLEEITAETTVIVVKTGSMPTEILSTVVFTGDMPVELLAIINASKNIPVESLQELVASGSLPVEVLQAVTEAILQAQEMPVELIQLDRVFHGNDTWTFVLRGVDWTQVSRGTDWTLLNEGTTWTLTK